MRKGWHAGTGLTVIFPVGNTGAIESGDPVVLDGAGAPYIMRATDGDIPIGIAAETVSAPTSDGDISISVYVDPNDLFWLPVITGTITTAMRGKSCDIGVSGTNIGLDVTASTDDCVYILDVDTTNNEALVRINFNAGFGGVV